MRTNLRNVRQLAPQKDPARDGKAPSGDLLSWSGMDFLASAFGMWTAFASRTVNRCCTDRLADLGIGKGVK
jgi:hypothetical protein